VLFWFFLCGHPNRPHYGFQLSIRPSIRPTVKLLRFEAFCYKEAKISAQLKHNLRLSDVLANTLTITIGGSRSLE